MAMRPLSASVELQQQMKWVDGPARVSHDEIRAIVEAMLGTVSGDIALGELKIYHELAALANFIDSAKAEIVAVRPDAITDHDIPLATDELDAVVGATEDATGTILDACEALETIGGALDAETSAKISNAVTSIYEACNFQDVTGQRITKVVKTLQHIEARVSEILGAFGHADTGVLAPRPSPVTVERAASAPKKTDDQLLNGPQLPDDAKKQAEIDAILASFD
jgi:chemotaxis protein CheZ